ncbi:MAG: tRNA epoxyqueuosine(34) reductase QueG [Gammaproteobacteria bacterium]|nr:tRNA epoxyqueuosine(34) reductase QueG [Gammaproteobacteria bacterium]
MENSINTENKYQYLDLRQLANHIKSQARALGFQRVGIADTNLADAEIHLLNWLRNGYQGEMEYMRRHGVKRSRPADLQAGTVRVISAAVNYWPEMNHEQCRSVLDDPEKAYVSRYALGRDYHKLLRKRLQTLANNISQQIGEFGYRVFTDSAPVLEKALAEKAGMGWIGKHTNLITEHTGSWFFIGEIYTDLPLPADTPAGNHCGTCQACIDACPTGAIIAPYTLDARLCISYLTIELRGSIPPELRPLIGNRIYGCDDCQIVCPWNRFARQTSEHDFLPRHHLDDVRLLELFSWTEQQFLENTEGSAIRRLGYECWLRNIAVALGNAPASGAIVTALQDKLRHPSKLVREHVQWALQQHQ